MAKANEWQWLGVDHITYAVWDITKWRAIYIDCFGFREIHYTHDACPGGASSMKLCGLEAGNSRVALVSPISRASISHVAIFLHRHGDHSIQHIAYAVHNLEKFVEEMISNKFKFLGSIKRRNDSFGPIKQIFAKRFDPFMDPAEGMFFEFVERHTQSTNDMSEFFSSATAEELYMDVEREMCVDDGESFINLPLFEKRGLV